MTEDVCLCHLLVMLLYRTLLDLASCACQNCHLRQNTQCRAYNKVSFWELKPNQIMTLNFQFSMKYNHSKHDRVTSDDWQVNALRGECESKLISTTLRTQLKYQGFSLVDPRQSTQKPNIVYLTLSALTLNFGSSCLGSVLVRVIALFLVKTLYSHCASLHPGI